MVVTKEPKNNNGKKVEELPVSCFVEGENPDYGPGDFGIRPESATETESEEPNSPAEWYSEDGPCPCP